MPRNISSKPVHGCLPADNIHPLDQVGVPQTNGGKHYYYLEHSWVDFVFSHWDIRRFDVCTMQGEKLFAVETTEDMNEFPFTTLSRKSTRIAVYDWKGFGHPTKVLCSRWAKRKKKEHEWMLARNYVKSRARNTFRRSSAKAIYHTFTTFNDGRQYVWQSTKDNCVLYWIQRHNNFPGQKIEFPVIASVRGPELITTGPFKGTTKRVLRYNEIFPLGLDSIMSTFLIVDNKRYKKFFPAGGDFRHPVAHLFDSNDRTDRPLVEHWFPSERSFVPPDNPRTVRFADEINEELAVEGQPQSSADTPPSPSSAVKPPITPCLRGHRSKSKRRSRPSHSSDRLARPARSRSRSSSHDAPIRRSRRPRLSTDKELHERLVGVFEQEEGAQVQRRSRVDRRGGKDRGGVPYIIPHVPLGDGVAKSPIVTYDHGWEHTQLSQRWGVK